MPKALAVSASLRHSLKEETYDNWNVPTCSRGRVGAHSLLVRRAFPEAGPRGLQACPDTRWRGSGGRVVCPEHLQFDLRVWLYRGCNCPLRPRLPRGLLLVPLRCLVPSGRDGRDESVPKLAWVLEQQPWTRGARWETKTHYGDLCVARCG